MITEDTLIKFGFVKDKNNSQLKEVLKDNTKMKEIHIDAYPENPLASSTSFMLLLRVSERNAMISNDGDRIILKKDDKCGTHFMNILFDKIIECFYKACGGYLEFILNIQNIYYKITVFN